MADELCASLAAHERRGRTIGIKVRLDDFTTATRARTIDAPTNDATQVTAVALGLLAEYAPQRPVRLLGVRVAGLSSGAPAASVTGGPGPERTPDGLREGQDDLASSERDGATDSSTAVDQLSMQV